MSAYRLLRDAAVTITPSSLTHPNGADVAGSAQARNAPAVDDQPLAPVAPSMFLSAFADIQSMLQVRGLLIFSRVHPASPITAGGWSPNEVLLCGYAAVSVAWYVVICC